jgi:uncharacterized protein (DUF305 family)
MQMFKRGTGLILGLLTVVMSLSVGLVYADAPVDSRAGRAELRFLEGMIDHHQMALDMAGDCLAKATSEDLKTLCQNIIDAQTAEIELMQGWLLDWYNVEYTPVAMTAMADMDGHGGHTTPNTPYTDPAMMMGMMAGLNRLEGQAYDIAWLESMVDHHDDAIHMSERLLSRVGDEGHTELSDLANKIITDQSAEIEQMETMITSLEA